MAIDLLDLHGFNVINDTLGHHIGDLLLQDVAKRIMSNVEEIGVPPPLVQLERRESVHTA